MRFAAGDSIEDACSTQADLPMAKACKGREIVGNGVIGHSYPRTRRLGGDRRQRRLRRDVARQATHDDCKAVRVPSYTVDRDDVGPPNAVQVVAVRAGCVPHGHCASARPSSADDLVDQVIERESGVTTADAFPGKQRGQRDPAHTSTDLRESHGGIWIRPKRPAALCRIWSPAGVADAVRMN